MNQRLAALVTLVVAEIGLAIRGSCRARELQINLPFIVDKHLVTGVSSVCHGALRVKRRSFSSLHRGSPANVGHSTNELAAWKGEETMWNLIPWKSSGGNGGTMTAEPIEREFNRIRRDFDRLFARMWSRLPGLDDDLFEGRGAWGVDTDETDTHFIVRIPAPGFEVEDFDVHVSGNRLVVNAERKQSEEDKNGGSSYRYGQVQRMISLPEGVETDQIDASYHSGVLELKIPKGKEAQAKRIEVKAG